MSKSAAIWIVAYGKILISVTQYVRFQIQEMEIHEHESKMAAMPIYGKNSSKIFSRTGGPIFLKLYM